MYKSTSDKASNEGELISKKDVGKKVIVGRVGAGTLMYVGPVEGKTGIFCGVELDRPEGKHDGTYQGIAYFHCAPQHGIFAPSYKVELLQQVPVSSRREEKLVRSAIPAIAGTDMVMSTGTGTTQSAVPSMDISMASISSLGSSSILDHSMIGRSHYQLLEEIECPSELIEVDDDVPYPSLNTSLVLEESRIGVDRLPIVDDNLSTPLVEYAPSNDFQQYQQHQAYMLDNYGNNYHAYQGRTDVPTELAASLPITQLIHSDILPYESDFSQQVPTGLSPVDRVPSSMSIDSTISDDVNVGVHPLTLDPLEQQRKSPLLGFPPEQEVSPTTRTRNTEAAERESNCYKQLNCSFMINKETEPKEHSQLKGITTEKPESVGKEEKKDRPKKPRPLSVRELQNAPVPVRPPKPKPPSKSQLLMEKLKASIEADKLKPKRDVKSKLRDLLTVPAPVRHVQPQTTIDENEEKMSPNEESKKIVQQSSPNAKRRRNEALKRVNSKVRSGQPRSLQQPDITTATTSRPPTKSRQLLIQPKTVQKGPLAMRSERLKKEASKELPGASNPKSILQPSNITRSGSQHSSLPTSSTVHSSLKVRKYDKQPTSMTIETHRDDTLKLKRLTDAVRGFDVLAIVFSQQIQKYSGELYTALEQNRKYESHVKALEAKYEELLVAVNADHARQIENVNRNHEDELNSVKERYEKQLVECNDELMRTLDEQRCIHEAQIERLSRSNQIQCANLDSKLAEAEKVVEELIRDKKNLEATLSKDTNEKVAELSKEISSLNTALEIKSTEIKTLRHSNAKLQLKVEEIPLKDIEISKLKHRVRELKILVDQKTSTEKVLTSRFEELQRSARNQAVMSESMLKENDLLRYKIEEMESSTSEGEPNSVKADCAVKYRSPQPVSVCSTRLCQSERRPPSSVTPHRSSQSRGNVMTRSIISLYLEQGRNRFTKENIDTIYTPEGTFIAKDRGCSQRLSFDDAHDADDEGTPRLVQTNEQSPVPGSSNYHEGASRTTGTVIDSGISV
ncbi:hypothetical protein LOAG_16846 [Loa loa]|uniref:CAP-Gly domain-containing protein n=1 Tax=Loa loa TaxID=7209 RepID=A0A1S0UMW1_LOALO|nr:hypothetical protein LOAG_16846 [Loa loa]EJD76144.1 hypothetical protein LOAG_16846 [Loa loa]